MKKAALCLIAVSSLFLSGCFRFYVAAREYKPILPVPTAPELTQDAPFENEDFEAMIEYSMRLEAVIDSYNRMAKESNIANGFEEEE